MPLICATNAAMRPEIVEGNIHNAKNSWLI